MRKGKEDLVPSLVVSRLGILVASLFVVVYWLLSSAKSPADLLRAVMVGGAVGLIVWPRLIHGQLPKAVEAWSLAFLDVTLVAGGLWMGGGLVVAYFLVGDRVQQPTALLVTLSNAWEVALLAAIFVWTEHMLRQMPKGVGRRIAELVTYSLTAFLLVVLGGTQLHEVSPSFTNLLVGSLTGLGLGLVSYWVARKLYASDLDQLGIEYVLGLSSLLSKAAYPFLILHERIYVGDWMATQHFPLSLWRLHREGSRAPLKEGDTLKCGDRVVAERK